MPGRPRTTLQTGNRSLERGGSPRAPTRVVPVEREALRPLGRNAPAQAGIAPLVRPGTPDRSRSVVPGSPAPSAGGTATGGHGQGLFAASVHASSGTLAVSASHFDHHHSSFAYGCHPYWYSYSWHPYYSACYAPWYAGFGPWPVGWSSWWGPGWYAPSWGWSTCTTSSFGFAYFGSRWRFSVGFGYAVGPWCGWRYAYPCYRRYAYFPYHYYSTVVYYPAYSVVYHTGPTVVSYSESYDPYVEYVDEVPAAAAAPRAPAAAPAPAAAAVPAAFQTPIVADFPVGMSGSEALARAEAWIRSGEYLLAAEAFRRAWVSAPDDYFAPLQLGHALFLAQGRVPLAAGAIAAGLRLNPSWIGRSTDLRESFGAAPVDRALMELERLVVSQPRDPDARFLLAYARLQTGAPSAARSEIEVFEALAPGHEAAGLIAAEVGRRLDRGAEAPR